MFEIIIEEKNIVLIVSSTQTQVEIFFFGALLNKFIVLRNGKGFNVIDGYKNIEDAKENITNGFKSAKLSPFVCRLKNGRFNFENAHYKINKFYLNDEAIHGLLYDAEFEIAGKDSEEDRAFVKLKYVYNKKTEGFPFQFKIEIIYELKKDNALSITTIVTNQDEKNMPLSDGWHPYFTFEKTIDNLLLQINSKQMVEFDEKLLPTGKFLPYTKFNSLKKIENISLDNCFVLNENAEPACVLRDEESGLQLNIIPEKSYPYLQIYTPPERQSIAIENLSSAPDSFNNKIGLIILKPKEERVFKTTYQLSFVNS
ncbi:MAG: aldose 1-epimerase [Chitinophagaceae bacterium]